MLQYPITSKEKVMKQEIEAFLKHISAEKKFSENTIAAYKNDLYQFAEFAQEKDKGMRWAEIDRQIVLHYLRELKQRGYALATVARKTASVKSLFKYLVTKSIMTSVPTDNVGSPKVKKNLPHHLSAAQVKELLRQPEKYHTSGAQRDKAMLELLYASGLLVSELISLNVEDLNFQKDFVLCRINGSKERILSISLESVPALQKYIGEARIQLTYQEGERALFLNRLGERLTRQGFWQIMKNYAKEAKLEGDVTPRILRHSFAAHTLDRGVDLLLVQQNLGHANISTTQVYTQLNKNP